MPVARDPTPKDAITWTSILRLWPIILLFATLVGGWVSMGLKIEANRTDIARLETTFQKENDALTDAFAAHLTDVAEVRTARDQQYLEMSVALAGIQAQLVQNQKDLLYIRQQLDSHVEAEGSTLP